MKPIALTKRVIVAIVAISACVALVSGAILANYLVPSTVNITSQPGITVYPYDSVALACTNTPVTTFAIGDVQQSQSKAFGTVCIKDTGGTANAFILPQSLTTTSALPSGISLTWNFPSTSPTPGICSAVVQCIGLGPGSQTQPLTLTLSAANTAPVGPLSFTVQFDAYSTASG